MAKDNVSGAEENRMAQGPSEAALRYLAETPDVPKYVPGQRAVRRIGPESATTKND